MMDLSIFIYNISIEHIYTDIVYTVMFWIARKIQNQSFSEFLSMRQTHNLIQHLLPSIPYLFIIDEALLFIYFLVKGIVSLLSEFSAKLIFWIALCFSNIECLLYFYSFYLFRSYYSILFVYFTIELPCLALHAVVLQLALRWRFLCYHSCLTSSRMSTWTG